MLMPYMCPIYNVCWNENDTAGSGTWANCTLNTLLKSDAVVNCMKQAISFDYTVANTMLIPYNNVYLDIPTLNMIFGHIPVSKYTMSTNADYYQRNDTFSSAMQIAYFKLAGWANIITCLGTVPFWLPMEDASSVSGSNYKNALAIIPGDPQLISFQKYGNAGIMPYMFIGK